MAYNFEDELDEIRVKLYEKYKDCSNEEFIAGINERGRAIAKEYGITVTKRANETSVSARSKCL
jgi:hypothetical protein